MVQTLLGVKRTLDFLIASSLLLFLSPVLVLIALYLKTQGQVFRWTPKQGRWCQTYYEYSFNCPDSTMGSLLAKLNLDRLPVLFNILKGDLSFIGPRAVELGVLSPRQRGVRKRYNIRPGLICLWWLRRRANIAYESEVEMDGEYVDSRTIWGDLGIALRAIPAILYGEGVDIAPDVLTVLGIPIQNLTMEEVTPKILKLLNRSVASQVCFINAHCANLAYQDQEYAQVLIKSELTLADGIGLKLAGKLLGKEIKQNINGTDLFPRLCQALSGTNKGIFLLGGQPGVAKSVSDWIAKHYPKLLVKGFHHGFFTPEEEQKMINKIADSGAQLLLVAFGVPHQDKWISRHLKQTKVKTAIGVGGLFDFYSGRIPRAPLWMREMGLEWIYRFYQEPGRMWKRYLVGNFLFLFRVVKEKIREVPL